MEPTLIKRLLLARVFALRRNTFAYDSLDRAQSVQDDVIQTPEGPRKRRRVVLTAHGCSVATCTMCPLPDEAVDDAIPVTLDHWMNQIRGALAGAEDVHTLTLFHNGNTLADREVSQQWRRAIYAYVREAGIKELVVESLPQYLTADRLEEAREALGPTKLTVAIGLQSSSPLVRELCIASTCVEDTFRDAVERLHAQGDAAQAFLMFHPPFLTIEESTHDLRESVRYCAALGLVPTICPMRIAPHTVVADLAARGLYEAPDLWHLYDALQGLPPCRVAASLLSEHQPVLLRNAFTTLNQTGVITDLGCWSMRPPVLEPRAPDRDTVLKRIEAYLTTL